MSHEGNDLILENYYEEFFDSPELINLPYDERHHKACDLAWDKFHNGPHGDHEND